MTVPVPVGAGSITASPARVDSRIARVVRVGTLVSIGLLAIGVALMALVGRSSLDGSWPALGTAVLAPIALAVIVAERAAA